jgi:competence protein ComEA
MQRLKAWIRYVFGFSRAETNGFLILLPLIFLVLLSGPMYRQWLTTQEPDLDNDHQKLDSLIAALQWDSNDSAGSPQKLFAFNPNNATREELLDLGISGQVVGRIINYRTKGGKFRVKSDFKKMYGLDSAVYATLLPFLKLPDQTNKLTKLNTPTEEKPRPEKKEKFDLNIADTTQLKSIYGIGTVRAERLVKFRNKLGGFISMDQLKEVYGLDTTSRKLLMERSFISPDFSPTVLGLNSATESDLAAHPYLNYKLAKAITTYRFQHGAFQNIDELQKIALIKEELFHKIKPYLSLD